MRPVWNQRSARQLRSVVVDLRPLATYRHLYEDGDLTREEYVKRKESNEREIAHWESRTT